MALQGAGNKPGDTVVHLSNLMNHLGKAVPESARTLYQAEQVPFFDTAAEDFAVAMLPQWQGAASRGLGRRETGGRGDNPPCRQRPGFRGACRCDR